MSYLVLARKWRPQDFSEVVGQQPVVRTLRNALAKKRVAHAMLFSGVRGTGKTTLARIMAKALNCAEGPTESPCGRCDSCLEIGAGTAVDLHEIDGASNRGIQEIRELKENIRFFPSKGRYKIIIIDEVHMLTTEAFNALLKTLEEPPAHVYFMFATTELNKIPITILSRCQRYELKRVAFPELLAHFKKIAAAEGVAISEAALALIVREADGSVRDGLSLLDQIFSFGGGEISDADVMQVLGVVDRQLFEELARALLAGELPRALELLDSRYAAGLDLKRFAGDLLDYVRGLLICRLNPKARELLDLPAEELAVMQGLAAGAGVETLYRIFQLLLQGVEEMHSSSQPRLALEMTFIKITRAGQVVPVAALLEKIDGLLRQTGLPAGGGEMPLPRAVLSDRQPAYQSGPPAPPVQPARERPVAPEPVPVQSPPVSPAPAPPPRREEPRRPVDQPVSNPVSTAGAGKDVCRHWEEFLGYVKERKQWMAHALRLSSGQREEEGRLLLTFDDPAECKMLEDQENLAFLAELAREFFRRELPVRLTVRGGGDRGPGPEGEGGSVQEERRALANDPIVQMTAEVFGGQVGNIRTGPGGRSGA
ncbi:MAG: DNA polymerase III subunit gamma/tau [Desulfobacteraceae bacterium]|nr:DNA polymerase III subunit gamma/tau [Desulfobacteraceae bacterium]